MLVGYIKSRKESVDEDVLELSVDSEVSPEFNRAPLTLECRALIPGDNRADVYTRISQKQSGLQKSIDRINSLKHDASPLKFNILFINKGRMVISFQRELFVLQVKLVTF